MLPFLKPKRVASIIMQSRKPDGTAGLPSEEAEHPPELMKHAEDLISAMHAKDASAVANVMQNIHEHMNPKPAEGE